MFTTILISMILNACGQNNIERNNSFIKSDSAESIELLIGEKAMAKLEQKRQLALYDGHLYSTDDDWAKAKFVHNNDTINAEVRLKGDFYDHWIDKEAWSFKVKLKGGAAFLGMRKFALQLPKTRGGLNEWIFHQILESQDLISLRYDFLKVKINGVEMPIYAIEENFDKILIEHNELREGVIFQLSNKYYWLSDSWEGNSSPIDSYFGAMLLPYGESKILKNEKLNNQFKIARNLMTQYQIGKLDAHEVFDITKMAKFFIVVDLMGHHHACFNDNMKLYLNPVTSLLEPVGYDNSAILKIKDQGVMGEKKSLNKMRKLINPSNNDYFMNRFQYNLLFKDVKFYKEYIIELYKITNNRMVDSLISSLDSAIEQREVLLQTSQPKYSIKWGTNTIKKNASYIKDSVLVLTNQDVNGQITNYEDGICSIQLVNKKTLPIEVRSLTIGNDTIYLDSNFILQPWMNEDQYAQLEFKCKGSFPKKINININLYGLDQVKKTIPITKENVQWGKSNNFLSVVPNEQTYSSNLNIDLPKGDLEKQIAKAEEKNYIDSTLSGIHVYFKKYSEKEQTITLGITNVSWRIVEILDLRYLNKWIFKPTEKIYIPKSEHFKSPYYKEITFKVPSLRKSYLEKKDMNFPWQDKMIEKLSLNFRHPGALNHKSQEVFQWAYENKGLLDTNIVRQAANFKSFDFLKLNESTKEIWIEEGQHTISSGIKIPEGYSVFAKENVTLDFTNASFLLSYSPISFIGTPQNPIVVTSSDKTGMGIVVLNAKSTSTFNYVNFSQNRALDRFGMSLTGMLTFYESDVEFDNCELSHNNSEDILNIIRSNYKISNCFIHDVFSDALDCDFSSGSVKHVKFKDIGNDAIDISGRSIDLFNVNIDNAEDKGVSAGENSIMKGDQITIINSGIGVSAKDLSSIKFGKLILEENKLDFAVFQKKSEYGPAKIVIEKTKESKNYLLEFGSSLSINGEFKKDYRDNVLGLLYGNLYGKNSH